MTLDQFDPSSSRDWDDKLTVEVVSPHAALRSIEIASAPVAPTIFLGRLHHHRPRWRRRCQLGTDAARFFKPGVAVANNGQSGETMKSFMNALRLDKILSQMKKGDYLFLQFIRNHSKASWPQTYVEPETTYKAYLKVYIAETRLRGATPVLVTAMDGCARHRRAYPWPRRLSAGHARGRPGGTRAFIDLYSMSDVYMSPPARTQESPGRRHHSTAYGGYEFECSVMGIKQNKLDLANYIVDGFKDFDPAHPDTAAALDGASLHRSGAGPRPGGSPSAPGAAPAANPPAAPATPVWDRSKEITSHGFSPRRTVEAIRTSSAALTKPAHLERYGPSPKPCNLLGVRIHIGR